MVDPKSVLERFSAMFGREARVFAAPGRVNLIGEHTDYNDGFVLPIAIDRQTITAAAKRDDRRMRVHSANANETLEFNLDEPGNGNRGIWLDYVEGVARVLESRGTRLVGADLFIDSDVPLGAGLSSSAALEVSTGYAMLSIADVEIDRIQLALAAQKAEHSYVGTLCGIMDQFISALGQRNNALLIDCRYLDASPVPIDTSEIAVVICDSNVRHELATSEYNTRRRECERSVELLRVALPGIQALRDVTLVDFDEHGHLLPDPLIRRARHVVTENVRTITTTIALRAGELDKVGRLMLQSHMSLRDDFEVSTFELDTLVEIAGSIEGVVGARMTGGGFGGSIVALAKRSAIDEFRSVIAERYTQLTGKTTTVYVTSIDDGARELTM
ncbi:MAG: galactokinase [bacterium]|nr:galactokinase [Candidatus Kapabacteria bacterium]